ncbi:MAG: pilus assembly protein N-terminal domain-containing protein [Devosia sp.]
MLLPRFTVIAAVVALMAAPSAAFAETSEPISVKVNMARILKISAPAATVIIGNPAVADITIQDPQTLILTGKSYGETNLIVLDAMGNPVADTMITVVQAQSQMLTMYMGSARNTLSCEPICQPTLMMGDDVGFSSLTLQSSSLLKSAAASP